MDATVDRLRPELMQIFEHLHRHPETSWKEFETTAYIKQHLEAHGCRTRTFCGIPGVVGEIGAGHPKVGIRADMDALWQEVDGEFRANHSCGHDAHMTMVLGTLMALSRRDALPQGTIRFIFQPAEEKGTGALKMLDFGVVDDLDYLYGVHVRPVQEVEDGKAAPAILHGAGYFVEGNITGEDAHGARPHLGINAIEVGASLVHKLAHIHVDPAVPHSVKVTKFIAGGESGNVIPGNASFSIDARAQKNDTMREIKAKVEKAVQATAQFYGADIRLTRAAELPAAEPHPQAIAYMAEAIKEVLGPEHCVRPLETTGGEDFHYYGVKRPQLKTTMLGLGCDLQPGLHHPRMTFNREAVLTGVKILTCAVLKTMGKNRDERRNAYA